MNWRIHHWNSWFTFLGSYPFPFSCHSQERVYQFVLKSIKKNKRKKPSNFMVNEGEQSLDGTVKGFTTAGCLGTFAGWGQRAPWREEPSPLPTLAHAWDLAFVWWVSIGPVSQKPWKGCPTVPPEKVLVELSPSELLRLSYNHLSLGEPNVHQGACVRITELKNKDQRFQAAGYNSSASLKKKMK